MKKTRLEMADTLLIDRAARYGVHASVEKTVPRNPRWTFVRQGDAMTLAVGYTRQWATWWLEGYTTAVLYPARLAQVDPNVLYGRRV